MPQKLDLAKREVWRRRLRDFERGSATIVEFCRRMGVPVWSFYYWQQRLRSGTIKTSSDQARDGTVTPTRRRRFVHRAGHGGTKSGLNFVPIRIAGHRPTSQEKSGALSDHPTSDKAAWGHSPDVPVWRDGDHTTER